ncbi:hypothetical protein B0O80DRAFT_423897 [Mortierella sp. GBAus27b]|nr:hypothetical protein B0O80DRAFT_423897 [Mortierella sp. GBAus27b]
MWSGSGETIPLTRIYLASWQCVELAGAYMEMIRKVNDPDIILKLCYDVDASLSQLIKCARNNEASSVRDVLVPYFFELVRVLESRNYTSEAGIIRKKAEKWSLPSQLFCMSKY